MSSPHPKPVIGLAGAPGSGKSAVARHLTTLGCTVIDADALGHMAFKDPAIQSELRKRFGSGIFHANGQVNRPVLGAIVFSQPQTKADLESIVHPWVHTARELARQKAFNDSACLAVVEDCPLLFEVGLNTACDSVVFVDAPHPLREERVKTRGWDAAELHKRESAQWPLDKKRVSSDHVLLNDGSSSALAQEVRRILDQIVSTFSSSSKRMTTALSRSMAEKTTRRRKSISAPVVEVVPAAEPKAIEPPVPPVVPPAPEPAPIEPAATAAMPATPLPPPPPAPFVLPENLLSLHGLNAMSPELLGKEAERLEVSSRSLDRPALIKAILEAEAKHNSLIWVEGVVELHQPDLVGFLRTPATSYMPTPDDIFIGPSVVRRLGLRHGQTLQGYARPPRETERYFTLAKADAIMGLPPEQAAKLRSFEDLVPHHPESRLIMETTPDELDTRIVDLVTPIGRGQRALIVAPPRTGKTMLLQKMAKGIFSNHPDVEVIVLLVDERPEEVTDFRMSVPKRVEVVASTFDERPERHMQVCEMVMEKARRMVEVGKHVVILMDSLTRMARAYNTGAMGSGKILSGGLDATAMQKPKKFFGSARAIEKGGSLTIIATALVETNSRGDEVIFEEFKGTGNAELYLSRALAEKRVYPAIDISKSGTRREELLMERLELQLIHRLRRVLSDMNPVDAMEILKTRAGKCKTNAEFLITMTTERD